MRLRLPLAFALSLIAAPALSASYTLTDLGTLAGDTFSVANALNDNGQVVGYSGGNGVNGVLWSPGQSPVDLGDLPGGPDYSIATDINNFGQIVGVSRKGGASSSSFENSAFLWQLGVMTDLGAPAGGSRSGASGINDSGVIVGNYAPASASQPPFRAPFRWENGTFTQLSLPSGYDLGNALAINAAGEIAGSGRLAGVGTQGLYWDSSGNVVDLPEFPGGTFGAATDIDSTGRMVGTSRAAAASNQAAAFWESTTSVTDLSGAPGGGDTRSATAMNDGGTIVGSAFGTQSYGFVYDPINGVRDLNAITALPTGWRIVGANDINESGQIVGQGLFNGTSRAFLLTPVDEMTPIPVPPALPMLAAALAALWWVRRRAA